MNKQLGLILSKTMKNIIVFLLLILSIPCKGQQESQYEATMMVKPKHAEINTIVATVNDKLKKFIDPNKTVFVVYAYKQKDTYLVQVTIFQKSDFGWFLRDTQEKIFGFFEYQDIPVVVFGESSNVLFTKTKEKIFFEWLKALPPLDKDLLVISSHFEPPAWKYAFLNGTFDFKGTDFWNYEHE